MRITMPPLGESVVEGTIGQWLKAEGETVQQYEPLLEIITDKLNAEFPSPVTGKVKRLLVPEGDTVAVGVEIAEIEVEAGAETAAIEPELEPGRTTQPTEATVAQAADEDMVSMGEQVQAIGSGPLAESEQRELVRRGEALPTPAFPGQLHRPPGSPRPYSPAVRRLAEEHHVDLTAIQGTGTGGRVTRRDVEQHLEQRGAAPAAPTAPAGPEPVVAEGDRLLPLTPMRRAIADHMVRSMHTAPHVTTVIEVDMTGVVRYREQVKDAFQQREGVPLGYVPFVIRAVVESLREHPILNSSWSEHGIILRRAINIGVAVGMEDGLIVPVIHGADEKSLVGLARAVHDLASRARAKQLTAADVQGGTFTVNNPGTYGTLMSTPIINSPNSSQPQAAILSMEAIVKRPVVIDDALAIRSMMYMSLSIDHRVLDGLQAARFLHSVRGRLEAFSPESAGL